MKPSRRLAWAKLSCGCAGRSPSIHVARMPREVVGGALAVAPARPGDDGLVVGADELLELGLGLLERARGEVGGLGAELDRLVARRSS